MYKKNLLFIFLLIAFSINAQTTLTVSGTNASSTEGFISYTIGQPFYMQSEGTNGSLSEGVQQPYEITDVLGIDQKEIALTIKAYPNPTTDILQLYVEDYEQRSFILYDIKGRAIIQDILSRQTTQINMQGLPQATYFLLVKSKKKGLKTFKIIKK